MGNGEWITMRPCKAFGHMGGQKASGACIECQRIYNLIRNSMQYYFNRIVLGRAARDSGSVSRAMYGKYNSRYRQRRYHRLRAQGMTWYEAKATMFGQTPERVRIEYARRSAAYKARWGGNPSIGSEAWKRRTLAAHEQT